MRVQFPPPAPQPVSTWARMEPFCVFFQRRTRAASALAQDGAVRRYCIRTDAALLVPWPSPILSSRTISIKGNFRAGHLPLLRQYIHSPLIGINERVGLETATHEVPCHKFRSARIARHSGRASARGSQIVLRAATGILSMILSKSVPVCSSSLPTPGHADQLDSRLAPEALSDSPSSN